MQFTRLLGGMAILACSAALVAGCGHGPESSPGHTATDPPSKSDLPLIKAEVWTVEPGPWPTIVRAQGSLTADEVAAVGVKVAGRVATVHVDLGDEVSEGEPLVSLDDAEFVVDVARAEAQLAQARSAIGLKPGDSLDSLDPESAPPVRQEKAVWEEAKAKRERSEQLRAQNAITALEFDQIAAAEHVAEAMYDSALNSVHEKIALVRVREAELALAQQRLNDAVVRAPFDGLVQERQVAPGSYVQAGDPIATIVRSKTLRFRGTIPERHAHQLALGQQVTLHMESVAEPRTAVVTRISPALDPLSRALLFEARIDNPQRDLRAGLFAEADVELDPNARSLVVPRTAVVEFAGVAKVWRVVDGVLVEHPVQVGGRRDAGIEIIDGLAAGDLILLKGSEGRTARIEPITAPSAADSDRPVDDAQPQRTSQHSEGSAGVLAR